MAQLPAAISFDRWLDYLFAEPVGPSGFRESDDWWDEQAEPEVAVDYLTRFFEQPEITLERYPPDQIDRGLWFLAGESGHLGPLLGPPVSWEARRRGLLAIAGLYERLFAPVCTNHLGHVDRGPEPPNPLNSICYMWWDLFPTWGGGSGAETQRLTTWGQSRQARRRLRHRAQAGGRGASDPLEASLNSVDEVILHVLERTLRLESEPCREGALHGLGHWNRRYPERTAAIIETWLATRRNVSPQLIQYARSARTGCVL